MAVAETFEAAREAAFKVKVSYHPEPAMSVFDAKGVETCALADIKASHVDPAAGDAAAALSLADVRIDAEYETPAQHHNAIELYAAACVWNGPKLTIYEPSQTVAACSMAWHNSSRSIPPMCG